MINIVWRKSTFRIALACVAVATCSASCNPFASSTPQSFGVLRTDNGGGDFVSTNKVESTDKKASLSLNGTSILKLSFGPDSSNTMFAATRGAGLFKSSNSGESWKQILTQVTVNDYAVDPGDAKHIYAATEKDTRTHLVETTNDGASWQEIFTQAVLSDPIVGVKISPFSRNDLIALLKSGVLVSSNDAGKTWKSNYTFTSSASWFSWHQSGVYVLLPSLGLYRSTDGGLSFTEITASLKPKDYSIAGVINLPAGKSINSYYAFAVSQNHPGTVYMVTDAGLLQTENSGSQWKYLELPAKKDSSAPLSQVAISSADDRIVYVSSEFTLYKSMNAGVSWQVRTMPGNSDVGFILPHPSKPETCYIGLMEKSVSIF